MPTVAHTMETARALYQSSMAGALIEVNKRGQIQTASFGTRLRDAAIHLFLGESARMDFRASKAQQVAAKFLTLTQATHRAQQSGAEPMNLRNATVGSNHPVYETISGHFARAATYERPVAAGDQAFGNATYESIDEASYEVPVSSRQAVFNNATYASIDEALYEEPVSARSAGFNNAMYASVEDAVYAEIPSAVADTIREYASSQDLNSEILAQARPMVAYKVGQHIVPVGVGHDGQVYRHILDRSAPASAREAVAWVDRQLSKKTCDVQGVENYDGLVANRVLSKLGIVARFKTQEGNALEYRSVLETIPQSLKDRFAHELASALAQKAATRRDASPAPSSVLYERLNSGQADSVIHRELAAASGLTASAKEMAMVMFDNLLAKTIQGATRIQGEVRLGAQELVQAAAKAIVEAKKQFPATA